MTDFWSPLLVLPVLLLLLSTATPARTPDTNPEASRATSDNASPEADDDPNLQLLDRVSRGEASFIEVRQALSNPDVGAITNVLHAMYSMRWQRLSVRLLLAIWARDETLRERFPELAWQALDSVPARLALASTLLRIEPQHTGAQPDQYIKYLLEHRYDSHEFHRAQVVVGLGLHGNPDDIDYLLEMADSDTPYVVQAAVTSLGLMRSPGAQRGLGRLWKKHRNTPRGDLIEQVLATAYRVTPHIRGEEQPTSTETSDDDKEPGGQKDKAQQTPPPKAQSPASPG